MSVLESNLPIFFKHQDSTISEFGYCNIDCAVYDFVSILLLLSGGVSTFNTKIIKKPAIIIINSRIN